MPLCSMAAASEAASGRLQLHSAGERHAAGG